MDANRLRQVLGKTLRTFVNILPIVAGLYGLVALFDREAAGRSLQVFAVLGGLVMGWVEEGRG